MNYTPSVKSPGCFGGGDSPPPQEGIRPDHVKAITRPRRESGGRQHPRTVMKFNILKRFKVLEDEYIFRKYQHSSCPKNPFFPKKNFEKLNIFYKDFWFFEKLFENFQFSGVPYKSRGISHEFYYISTWDLYQKTQKWLRSIKDYWKWYENSWKFWKKSTVICRKHQVNQDLTKSFHQTWKLRNMCAEFCKFGPKMKKVLRFSDLNLYG